MEYTDVMTLKVGDRVKPVGHGQWTDVEKDTLTGVVTQTAKECRSLWEDDSTPRAHIRLPGRGQYYVSNDRWQCLKLEDVPEQPKNYVILYVSDGHDVRHYADGTIEDIQRAVQEIMDGDSQAIEFEICEIMPISVTAEVKRIAVFEDE